MVKIFFRIAAVFVVVVLAVALGCQQEKDEARLQEGGSSTPVDVQTPTDAAPGTSLLDQMRSQIDALPEQGMQDKMEQARSAVKTLEEAVPLRDLLVKESDRDDWLKRIITVGMHYHSSDHHSSDHDHPPLPEYSEKVAEYAGLLERLTSGEASLEESTDAVSLLRITRWYVSDVFIRTQGKKRFDDLFDAANILEEALVGYIAENSP